MNNQSTSRNKKSSQSTRAGNKTAGAMKQGGRMLNTPAYENYMGDANFLLNRLGNLDLNSLSPDVRQQLRQLSGNAQFLEILEESNPKLAYQILEDAPQFRPENFTQTLLH